METYFSATQDGIELTVFRSSMVTVEFNNKVIWRGTLATLADKLREGEPSQLAQTVVLAAAIEGCD